MTKALTISACLIAASVCMQAGAATKALPQLLSLQFVNEGNIDVALPTVMNSDGTICRSYIAEVTSEASGAVATTVKQICGAPNASKSGPANLVRLENVESGGVVIQTPTVTVNQ
ncbi:hypothetical protein [Burkholderia sp. Ac-20365]|uniref:hypothetical protein n=1 Tax=Burkholderia sp. Ac-20365 TaxID=2703897 RepID=UPI00197BB2C4|nr:hypothetical protein [Burkholderia sp. Ac-20365]MBN3761258.1 hypothetical protein [Burkholderia sp. Ac-20365]